MLIIAVNPGHWTEDMREDALSVAELSDRNLKVPLQTKKMTIFNLKDFPASSGFALVTEASMLCNIPGPGCEEWLWGISKMAEQLRKRLFLHFIQYFGQLSL